MLPLFDKLRLESIPGSIQAECLKIDIKPVERISFYIFVLHPEVYFAIIISCQINQETPVLIFKKITEITGIHQDTGILRALLYEVLMLLNRAYRTSIPPETGKEPHKDISSFHLSRFFELVGEHFREQHSVQFYADKLCITPNYLNEILSSAININAKQYILNKVTDEAQRLLTYTDLPISEIASELHFSTVSYFVRSFRQCIGYTPLAYRKMEKP